LAAAVAGKIRLDNINDNVIFYYKFFRLVGLGYRAYKVETGVLLIEVGYSHYCILVLRDLPINFLVRKDKLLFYSTNRQILSSLVKHFLLIKPLNPYTLKGVRFLKMSYVRKLRKKDRVR
jgi:ribosomal protein L6P/L9E